MVVPPDLDRLRKVVSRFLVASSLKRSDQRHTPYVKIMGPSVDDVAYVLDAARFLLSLLDEGGRLIVETHCEHGELEEHYLCDSDMTLHDARTFTCVCPGGSRMQVWPAGREER